MSRDTEIVELLDCGLLSRQVHKYIRDPIHIYIPFSKLEETIIDSSIFQRLRRIHQLQVAYSVYPGATHNRFIHSVGVMHLAGKFALSLLRTSHAYSGQSAPRIPPDEVKYYIPSYEELGIDDPGLLLSVLIAVRLGGLLHDIGHMPYSHAFDEAIISKTREITKLGIRSHEDTGFVIYKNFIRDSIRSIIEDEYVRFGVDAEKVLECVDYIMATREGAGRPHREIYSVVRHVVKEFVYPADIIDFCMRDAYFTGTVEYGRIDVDRIFMFSIILKKTIDGKPDPSPHIGLMKKAVGALRAFLYSRIWLFNNVYFHKFSRLMDYTIRELLAKIHEKKIIDFVSIFEKMVAGEEEAISELEKLDDGYILYVALEHGDEETRELARRVLYRKPFLKEVFSHEITIGQPNIEEIRTMRIDFEDVMKELKVIISEEIGIGEDEIIIDSPPIKFFPLNPYLPYSMFPLVDSEKERIVSVREADAWTVTGTQALDISVLRILIRKDALEKASISDADARRKISTLIDEDLEKRIKLAFIKKYSAFRYEVTM